MEVVEEQAHWRSFAKGLTWRIMATSITIVLSYFITGELALAFKIGPIDFVVKLFIFFFHERLWLLPAAQRLSLRRVLKMASWKVIALSLTMATTYYVSGSFDAALRVGPMDFFSKMFLFYAHEEVWNLIQFGKRALVPTADKLSKANQGRQPQPDKKKKVE